MIADPTIVETTSRPSLFMLYGLHSPQNRPAADMLESDPLESRPIHMMSCESKPSVDLVVTATEAWGC